MLPYVRWLAYLNPGHSTAYRAGSVAAKYQNSCAHFLSPSPSLCLLLFLFLFLSRFLSSPSSLCSRVQRGPAVRFVSCSHGISLMCTDFIRSLGQDRRRLEQALSQKQAENIQLGAKLLGLERKLEEGHARIRDHFTEFGDFGSYLESELEHKKTEIRRQKDELRTKVLEKMSESEKLRKAERGLHDADTKYAAVPHYAAPLCFV